MGEQWNDRFGDGIEKILYQDGKVGATAGWTVRAAADTWMSTMAQNGTGSTLVLPLPGLQVGDLIVGYHLLGQIDSAGNTVTLDVDLREFVPAVGASAAAALSGTGMTQVSVSADTKLDINNTQKKLTDANRVRIREDRSLFALITGTTGATTDVELLGLVLYVKRVN